MAEGKDLSEMDKLFFIVYDLQKKNTYLHGIFFSHGFNIVREGNKIKFESKTNIKYLKTINANIEIDDPEIDLEDNNKVRNLIELKNNGDELIYRNSFKIIISETEQDVIYYSTNDINYSNNHLSYFIETKNDGLNDALNDALKLSVNVKTGVDNKPITGSNAQNPSVNVKTGVDIKPTAGSYTVKNITPKEKNQKASQPAQLQDIKPPLKFEGTINTVTTGLTDKTQNLMSNINNKLDIYKKELGNESNGAKIKGGNSNIEMKGGVPIQDLTETNKIIEEFVKIMNTILSVPLFYKLRSLNVDVFKSFFISNIPAIFYIDNSENVAYTTESKQKFLIILANFMYIDLTVFSKINNDNERQDKIIKMFFNKEKYKELLKDEKFNKQKEIYLKLISSDNNNNNNDNLIIYVTDFLNLLIKLKDSNFNDTYKFDLYNFIIELINFKIENEFEQIIKILKALEYKSNIDFLNNIDNEINKKSNDNIITFLKLRNDEDTSKLYNRRFKIEYYNVTNTKPNKIIVSYNDDNFPYYKIDNDNILTSDEAIEKKDLFNNEDNILIPKIYKEKYMFGDFDELFLPNLTNKDIAKKMVVIKQKIIEKKPVFMLGYGASGAGKTSSLIYFNKGKTEDEKNGILIHLCNQLAADKKFDTIELRCKEFFHIDPTKNLDEPTVVTTPSSDNGIKNAITFHYNNNGNFVLNKEYVHNTNQLYRLHKPGIENYNPEQTVFKQETPLGEVVIHMIDTDRFVKATTNNPNSSRSHALIFVKLLKEGQIDNYGNIIIGDFAGVENAFTCDDSTTQKNFLNVKRDDGSGKLYYSTEPDYSGKPVTDTDPIGRSGGSIDKKKLKCLPAIQSVDPMYDFENPEIRSIWNLTKELDNYYRENKFLNLKIALMLVSKFANGNYVEIKSSILKKQLYLYKKVYELDAKGLDIELEKVKNEMMKFLNIKNIGSDVGKARNGPELTQTTFLERVKKYVYDALTSSGFQQEVKEPTFNSIYSVFDDLLVIPSFDKSYNEKLNQFINNYKKHVEEIKEKFDKIFSEIKSGILKKIFVPDEKTKIQGIIGEENELVNKDILDGLIENIFKTQSTELPESTKSKKKNKPVIYKNLVEIVKDLDSEISCRTANINTICKNRRQEGYFINDSLLKVREVIKEILKYKNQDSIELAPNFIDVCFDNYCPNNNNCFNFETSNKGSKPAGANSIIFNTIMEELGIDDNTELYKDIILSVFCVFNISRKANNPPPTPYVDINDLKTLFYFKDIYENKEEFTFASKKVINMIEKDVKNEMQNIVDPEGFKDKISNLTTIISKDGKDSIFNNFKTFFGKFQNDDAQAKKSYGGDWQPKIKEFIDMIDKSNAVSAIGTLEFLDQIAKYNTTINVCRQDKYLVEEGLNKYKENIFKELYE